MSGEQINIGSLQGGGNQIGGSSNVMYQAPQPVGRPAMAERPGLDLADASRQGRRTRWDVGVITVLSEETSAVAAMLDASGECHVRVHDSGLRCREAQLGSPGAGISVVATQTLGQGQQSAVIAFERLREAYTPTTVVLTGIAGAINPIITLGDVVVVNGVIHYDQRRETSAGITRRGQEIPVPARTRHAINAFFSDHGEPYRTTIVGSDGISRSCAVRPGMIGSGEAVVADQNSPIRGYVTAFNEKTLALETEAAGIAEAFYETTDTLAAGTGWLAIRGISDSADAAKDDTYHEIASWHAAVILRQMLPYLKASPQPATPY